jgi:hypothetical protein
LNKDIFRSRPKSAIANDRRAIAKQFKTDKLQSGDSRKFRELRVAKAF